MGLVGKSSLSPKYEATSQQDRPPPGGFFRRPPLVLKLLETIDVEACKNQEEMLALAKAEGIELSDKQLEAVSGGRGTQTPVLCPKCNKNNFRCTVCFSANDTDCTCLECGHRWTINKALRID